MKGEFADDAWNTALREASDAGDDAQVFPGLRRARLRYERRVADALAYVEGIAPSDVHCEERLVSADGTLEGTPDLVVVGEASCRVVDFKTGLVVDANHEMPKEDYAHQIRLYAHLASETYGVPVASGTLLSLRQGCVEVDVSPLAVAESVNDALDRRGAFNDRAPGKQPAVPSFATCKWCDEQATCDGFWSAIDDPAVDLAENALKGAIRRAPELSLNGVAAIQIDVSAGASAVSPATIADIPETLASTWCLGDIVSLTRVQPRSEDHGVYSFTARSTAHRWAS